MPSVIGQQISLHPTNWRVATSTALSDFEINRFNNQLFTWLPSDLRDEMACFKVYISTAEEYLYLCHPLWERTNPHASLEFLPLWNRVAIASSPGQTPHTETTQQTNVAQAVEKGRSSLRRSQSLPRIKCTPHFLKSWSEVYQIPEAVLCANSWVLAVFTVSEYLSVRPWNNAF